MLGFRCVVGEVWGCIGMAFGGWEAMAQGWSLALVGLLVHKVVRALTHLNVQLDRKF